MHGEYKVPGGKLVVIDLEVVDGRLRDVALSGDFFLEPEEALGWMTAALEGLPAESDEAAIAGRVRAAVAGAELIGLTPEGVALAVRRAVAGGAR
ncbi:MAG TPA: biotin--protein ligase [Roseiflexaceae bacterium]|nr:biotin--protein ligase [Roseiflexaceae bacterium]